MTRLLPGRAICRTCPVQAECLAYAIQHSIRHGIWGALDDSQRQRLAIFLGYKACDEEATLQM